MFGTYDEIISALNDGKRLRHSALDPDDFIEVKNGRLAYTNGAFVDAFDHPPSAWAFA